MDNKKKLTIVLAVLAVVCVFAVLVFSGIIDFSNVGKEEMSTDADEAVAQSLNYTASGKSSTPYLKTDIDGVFYTMKDGVVSFYRFENNTFSPIEATGKYTATVKLSEIDIQADITYITENGKICGYGLYTGEEGSYNLYQYAFFCLRSYGANYDGRSSKSCLLLIDTTEDDFYSNDKIYEESFIFKYDDETTSRSLSEASRTIGMNGAKRDDYFVISNKVIDGSVEHQLFLSGRYYSEDDLTVDLFRSGGSGNNTDNIRLAQDVLGEWAMYTDDGIMYITVNDDDNVTVECLDESTGDVDAVKTFSNVKRNDVLISDDYIYIISKNVLYSIADDKEIKIKTTYDNFKADLFAVSDDTLMLRGYIGNSQAAIIIASTETGDVKKECKNQICSEFVNPVIVNGQVVVSYFSNNEVNYLVF